MRPLNWKNFTRIKMKKTNNTLLVSCIEQCFFLATSSQLTPKQRNEMLALGKRLRGSLINLLTAQFNDDVKEVDEANAEIQAVDQLLLDAIAAVDNVADTVKRVNQLISVLDKLLEIAIPIG